MRPTVKQLEEKFDEYNLLFFGGLLRRPPISLNNRARSMGLTKFRKRKDGTTEVSIEISTRVDLPEQDFWDTLAHEMIHVYIHAAGLRDSGPHGRLFKEKMRRINELGVVKITVRYHPDYDAQASQRDKWRFVCVAQIDDGRKAIAVAARTRIFSLWDDIPKIPGVTSAEWYASSNAVFGNYRAALTPKLYIVNADDIRRYLDGAVRLRRQGNKIIPVKESK